MYPRGIKSVLSIHGEISGYCCAYKRKKKTFFKSKVPFAYQAALKQLSEWREEEASKKLAKIRGRTPQVYGKKEK